MSRLLIIDDDPQITSALARGLALHGYEAIAENRADLALERLHAESFDGAIVDVMLGADSGIDLVKTARARGILCPILMLSALSEVEHRAAGLEAGADDYVVKPFSFNELVARLRVQEHRAQTLRPAPTVLDTTAKTLALGPQTIPLTARECDLLALLIQTPDPPVSRLHIFDALWATEGSSNENVVDVYIGYLRKKLAQHETGFEIRTIRNRGFCIEGQPPKVQP